MRPCRVRPAEARDVAAFRFVMDWHGGVSAPSPVLADCASKPGGAFVLESAGRIVGQVVYLAREQGSNPYVCACFMYIDPSFRGRGYGGQLLDAVEQAGREIGERGTSAEVMCRTPSRSQL